MSKPFQPWLSSKGRLVSTQKSKSIVLLVFLALEALYLPFVSQSVSHCHFRIWTQRVTFEP